MSELSGRRVVVVGAGGALGDAVCVAALAAGAEVVGFERHAPSHPRDGVRYVQVDVLDDAGLGAHFDELGDVWAVLNLVGGFAGARPFVDFDAAELDAQVQLNVATAALVTKHALRVMTAAGGGRIVHTASRAALQTDGSGFAYSVSKLAVLHLVQMAARENRESGVTINAVVPSIMDTPANRASMPNADHARWPKVEDVAAVYLWLASPTAQLVTGAAVPVYGRT